MGEVRTRSVSFRYENPADAAAPAITRRFNNVLPDVTAAAYNDVGQRLSTLNPGYALISISVTEVRDVSVA